MPSNIGLYERFCGNKVLKFLGYFTDEFGPEVIKDFDVDIKNLEKTGFKIGFAVPLGLLKEKFMTRLDSVMKKCRLREGALENVISVHNIRDTLRERGKDGEKVYNQYWPNETDIMIKVTYPKPKHIMDFIREMYQQELVPKP